MVATAHAEDSPAEDGVTRCPLANGTTIVVRPIRPDDAPAWLRFLGRLSPPTRYKRAARRPERLTPEEIGKATDPDPASEIAYVAVTGAAGAAPDIIGVVRLMLRADRQGAEFALVVADRWQRKGVGEHLMRAALAVAAARGLAWIEGNILATNRGMIEFVQRLGFVVEASAPEGMVTHVVKRLA